MNQRLIRDAARQCPSPVVYLLKEVQPEKTHFFQLEVHHTSQVEKYEEEEFIPLYIYDNWYCEQVMWKGNGILRYRNNLGKISPDRLHI